jgi:2-methylcitrate dehydratase PrpD
MAHDGEVLTDQFSEARLSDPVLTEFMRRIRIEADTAYDTGGDATRHESRMAVVTRDGRRFEEHAQYRKGSPENPLSREERRAKFCRLAGAALVPARVEQIISAVESLDQAAGTERLVLLLQPSEKL